MSEPNFLPRILIVDDLFGRTHPGRRNEERANLCGQYLLDDVTGDEVGIGAGQRIKRPIAQAVFFRGQTPSRSIVGDTVINDLETTLRVIEEGWTHWLPMKPRWSLLVLDLCFYQGRVTRESDEKFMGMPEGYKGDDDPQKYFGLTILEAVTSRFPDLPIIILSSKDRREVSLSFTRAGAFGFLAREGAESPAQLNDYISRYGLIPDTSGTIIGHSKELLVALRSARNAALTRDNVLIRGEEGTGKELIAGYINKLSKDPAPFVPVNSATYTSELYASQLFGIVARIATGVDGQEGLIVQADGGDLFLDEVGDMLPPVQAGILRVLEDQQVLPVGGRTPRRVDVRYISATNKDLEAFAASGRFRRDLLDRLRAGETIYVVPLRERQEDIPLLVEKFVRESERESGAFQRRIEPEATERCMAYDWPGNLRALRSCIRLAVKTYPHVEHLVASHIRLPREGSVTTTATPAPTPLPSSVPTATPPAAQTLDELIDVVNGLDFSVLADRDLEGKLDLLKRALARLVARYLAAALEAVHRPTLKEQAGIAEYTPAVKLMRGDSTIQSVQAADEVKRLLNISRPDIEDLLTNTRLGEALSRAERLRRAKKKAND